MATMETTRSIQEIDPDIKAATLPVLQDVGRLYREGALGRVAESDEVRKALLEQGRLSQSVMKGGLGTENILNQLRNTEGAMLSAAVFLVEIRSRIREPGLLLSPSILFWKKNRRFSIKNLRSSSNLSLLFLLKLFFKN